LGARNEQFSKILSGVEAGDELAIRSAGGLEVHNTYLTIMLDLGVIDTDHDVCHGFADTSPGGEPRSRAALEPWLDARFWRSASGQ